MGQSRKPTVFGAPYSVYVRSVRLTLEEKAVDYDLVPVDIFAAGGPPREQVARHPFGKIPAFEHDSSCSTKPEQSPATLTKLLRACRCNRPMFAGARG